MKRVLALVMAAVALAVTGCSEAPSASVSACKADMVSQYQNRLNGGHPGTGPASCQGLSKSVLVKLNAEVRNDG